MNKETQINNKAVEYIQIRTGQKTKREEFKIEQVSTLLKMIRTNSCEIKTTQIEVKRFIKYTADKNEKNYTFFIQANAVMRQAYCSPEKQKTHECV